MAVSEQLPLIVKRDIVQRLAEYQGLTEIVKAVKEVYGIVLTPQRVQYYDPTKAAGKALAEDLKVLFHEARKRAQEDLGDIRIFHKANQLRALDRQLTKVENNPGPSALAVTIVQAAADISGTITKKHELTGKGGTPLAPAAQVTIFQLPDNGRK